MHSINVILEANGSTSVVDWRGGPGILLAQGDFGSGTLTLEFSIDGGTTWTPVGDASLTEGGGWRFDLGACQLRGTLAGATDPTVHVSIQRLVQANL